MADSKDRKKFMEKQYKRLGEADTFVPIAEAGDCDCSDNCGGDCSCD